MSFAAGEAPVLDWNQVNANATAIENFGDAVRTVFDVLQVALPQTAPVIQAVRPLIGQADRLGTFIGREAANAIFPRRYVPNSH